RMLVALCVDGVLRPVFGRRVAPGTTPVSRPGVARVLSAAFCVALLAATAGAFALTQGAKTELIPIYKTHVDKVFSPDCGCTTSVAKIDFRLRKKDRLTVWLNHDGERVRTLVQGRTYARGWVRLE